MTERLLPIREVADELGLQSKDVLPYGRSKAKIALEARDRSSRTPGRLVLVSAITPTRAGEGKTTMSIGLAQGLARIGERACLALREPSLGPTFGLKGGATGGGRSQVLPPNDINLHFTGDFHAISAAHNLLAATLDNHLHQGNRLGIDVRRALWPRVMDMNDRALRQIIVGLGGPKQGVPRETGFDISPASEVMAALCMADDPADLRDRLSRLLVGLDQDGTPVTAADLQAVGAMMALLKDACMPNLVQTTEGVPALIHGGPFANIAHGCNSVIATKMSMAYADWTVTEAGFGFDLGGEKFFDLKCRAADLNPDAVVLVATIRALKHHGGVGEGGDGPDPAAVSRGLPNLEKHIENVGLFDRIPLVALNRFADDTDEEVAVVRERCREAGIPFAEADIFHRGGDGGREMAEALIRLVDGQPRAEPTVLYPTSTEVEEKLGTIAREVYGARSVTYRPDASQDLELIRRLGYADLPLCVAKTPASFSDDASRVGRPADFELTVRRILVAPAAGYLVPLLGSVLRMPGLGAEPALEKIDWVDGEIVGIH